MWDAAIKRAGLRHRKSYQSRHTYACWSLTAGANPAFIANQMGHADAQWYFRYTENGCLKTIMHR